MASKLPGIGEYERLAYNPFKIKEGSFVTHWNDPKPVQGKGLDEGVIDFTGIVKADRNLLVTDVTPFVKFFKGSFMHIVILNNPALRMLGFIVEFMHPNKDFIALPVMEVLEYCRYKSRTSRMLYYQGIKELLKNNIVSPKASSIKNEYWINPNLFFNGDRRKLK